MKVISISKTTIFSVMLFCTFNLAAVDFDWMKDMNIQATADESGFRVQLAKRFKLDGATIDLVLNRVNNHSDAYMVMRLGELSQQPVNQVIKHYETHQRTDKGSGWGKLAKSLGIKPGSKEFHMLKAGHDLNGYDGYYSETKSKGSSKGKGNNKSKGRGKDKSKGKGKDK